MGTQHVHRVVVKKNLLQRGCTTIEEYRKLGSTNQWLPAQTCTTVQLNGIEFMKELNIHKQYACVCPSLLDVL